MADPVFHLGVGVYAAEDTTLRPAWALFRRRCLISLYFASDLSSGSAQYWFHVFVSANWWPKCHVDLTLHHDCINFWKAQLTALWHAKSRRFNVWESDIFKHPLTHISSIPKGGVEWLLVMLEQVLDISKAFNLEDLRFLLYDLPETNRLWLDTCIHVLTMGQVWITVKLA